MFKKITILVGTAANNLQVIFRTASSTGCAMCNSTMFIKTGIKTIKFVLCLIMSWHSIEISIYLLCFGAITGASCNCLGCFGHINDEDFDISGIDGSKLTDEFDDLDRYLNVQSTKTCNLEENMKRLLKQYKKDYMILLLTKPRTLKAYKLFLSLGDLPNTSKCNSEGFEIVRQNLMALKDNPIRYGKGDSLYKLRCIDEIFLEHLKKHANICADIYLKTFEDKLNSLDKEKAERVSRFVDEGMTRYTTDSFNDNKSKSLPQRLFFLVDSEMDFKPAYIYNLLQYMLRGKPEEKFLIPVIDDETGKIFLNKIQFEKLFNGYLFEPCEYFQKHFGADLFELTYREIQYHKVHEDNQEFYRNWARYRICANFINEAEKKLERTFQFVADNPKAYITALS